MKVGLAISTFRQDEKTLELLKCALRDCSDLFERIYIVDSLGSGAIDSFVQSLSHGKVVYENSDVNLGSAGNWARRLELAASDNLDWCFTVNHDGEVPRDTIEKFIRAASEASQGGEKVGAFYPLRYVPHRESFDFTGTQRYSFPYLGKQSAPNEGRTPVYWGSSNGSFYNLKPIREGLKPWADLWMGWEDLGYGWLLQRNGWHQFILNDAPLVDRREYLDIGTGGAKFSTSDKPAWYAYYSARNWLLVASRNERGPIEYAVIGARLSVESVVSGLFKSKGTTRLKYMAYGVLDSLRNRTGKWIVP